MVTSRFNDILENIRYRLEEEDGTFGDGEAGEEGAVNYTDAEENFDMYLTDLVDTLMQQYDLDEDTAMSFMFDVIDQLAEEGEIPLFPAEEATADELNLWLGKVKTYNLGAFIAQAASETEF